MRPHPYILLIGFGTLLWLVMELFRTGLIWLVAAAGLILIIMKIQGAPPITKSSFDKGWIPPASQRVSDPAYSTEEIDSRFGKINAALDEIPTEMKRLSGSVFYSGRSAFEKSSNLYLLGLNPGGDPVAQRDETIGADIAQFRNQASSWSAYRDESWQGRPAGTVGIQPRVLHMLSQLALDPRSVPASNVVFVRSSTEATLAHDKAKLLQDCWRVHRSVIDVLGIKTISCFGGTAGRWVREMVGANELVDSYREENARGWTSQAHIAKSGLCVLTLTHPSRANWCNPESDPTPLVKRMLNRTGG